MVGAWYELDLTCLRHHLDSLRTLNLWHHLVLDVSGCGVAGASGALLDGEHNRTSGARGGQACRELNHIALGRQESKVFGGSGCNWSRLDGEEPARLRLCWGRGDGGLGSRRANFTAGGSQESQRRRLGVLQRHTKQRLNNTTPTKSPI